MTNAVLFDKLIKLENNLKASVLSEAMAPNWWERERAGKSAIKTRAELFALLDTLSREQMKDFGEYRATL